MLHLVMVDLEKQHSQETQIFLHHMEHRVHQQEDGLLVEVEVLEELRVLLIMLLEVLAVVAMVEILHHMHQAVVLITLVVVAEASIMLVEVVPVVPVLVDILKQPINQFQQQHILL
jgi:hypothetical protein